MLMYTCVRNFKYFIKSKYFVIFMFYTMIFHNVLMLLLFIIGHCLRA
jgi:hypothetical protein